MNLPLEFLTYIKKASSLLSEHAQEDFVSKAMAQESSDDLQKIIKYTDNTLSGDLNNTIEQIIEELMRAESKHPNWPEDKVYAAAIVCEESGELMRAAVQFEMEKGGLDELKKEAIQTATTAIRLIVNL